MPKCEYCGKEVLLPFRCHFCGGYFCLEHRLPENHDCPKAHPRTPLGSYQTKILMTERARLREIEIATRMASFIPSKRTETKTYDNIYGYRFTVPIEVYSDKEYKEKLDKAKTLNEVERIIRDYRKHHKEKK